MQDPKYRKEDEKALNLEAARRKAGLEKGSDGIWRPHRRREQSAPPSTLKLVAPPATSSQS